MFLHAAVPLLGYSQSTSNFGLEVCGHPEWGGVRMQLPFIDSSLALLIGFISALLSSISGTGAALFATPLLLMVGFPLQAILAFNQVSAACWTLLAARNYTKDTSVDWGLIAAMAGMGLVGVFLGILLVRDMSTPALTRAIGGIIICVVLIAWLRTDLIVSTGIERISRGFIIAAGLPAGFYQAVFGAGNSMFTSMLFSFGRGIKLSRALGYSYFLAFPWCLASAVAFISLGWVEWNITIPGAVGAIPGAYLGSRVGRALGSNFIRRVFIVFGGCLGLKMLLM